MNGKRAMFCAVLFCLSALASAAEFSGKVIAVVDGDTLLVIRDGHPAKVRLAGIDAPEKAQPYGTASKESLAAMSMGKQVRVASSAVDDYGRLIAAVYVGEINVNREQVRRGMAWEYSRFHNNRDLLALQLEAQQAKRGLWAEDGFVEPSQWRKQHSGDAAALHHAVVTPVAATTDSASEPNCRKKHCSEIGSCEEARRYFTLCAQTTLDGDADGKPCESLCVPGEDTPGKIQ